AGHSFGATVAFEMARQLEAGGERVALLALLDARNLLPLATDIGDTFRESGLPETLALLSQSVPDGSRYAEVCEALDSTEPEGHEQSLRKSLGPVAMSALEHVHETFRWYAGLLSTAGPRDETEITPIASKVVLLRAAEAWKCRRRKSA
ncbi:unnamed protein product, partial [Polarella glacialis]